MQQQSLEQHVRLEKTTRAVSSNCTVDDSGRPTPAEGPVDAPVELYSPDFAHVYSVPRSGIYQMPPARMHITRFCACKNFSNAVLKAAESGNPDLGTEAWYKTACPLDTFCRFVHVARPLAEFPRQAIHVHYIWRSLKDVTYGALEPTLTTGDEPPSSPRLRLILSHDYRNQILKMREQCDPEDASSPKVLIRDGDVDFHARTEPGVNFMVGVMAAVLPSVRVPATRLLKTAGAAECLRRSQAGETVPELALCLTYLVENECRLGCECPYAHAINLDSSLNVPFIRRTLKQIKKAAIAMELVRSEGGAFSTTAMSAGSTPSFLPQDTITRFCSRRNSEFEFLDQLSLSFDSVVSNSVSEYSIAAPNNNKDGKHRQLKRGDHQVKLGVVGSDVDETLPSEVGTPMSNMMTPHLAFTNVFLGGPPTPALTPARTPRPRAPPVVQEAPPPTYEGSCGGSSHSESQRSFTNIHQVPTPVVNRRVPSEQQTVGPTRNLGNATTNIAGARIHTQHHYPKHRRHGVPRGGSSFHQPTVPAYASSSPPPPRQGWEITSTSVSSSSIDGMGHHYPNYPSHHHHQHNYTNPPTPHHYVVVPSPTSHSGCGLSPESSGVNHSASYNSASSTHYHRNRW